MKRLSIFFLVLGLTGCGTIMQIVSPVFGGSDTPSVTSVTPDSSESDVSIGAQVNAVLDVPNGKVNLTTVNEQSVRLSNVATGAVVEANVAVDNEALTLTLDPVDDLDFSTEYRFTVTSALEDEIGEAFEEYSSTFTTLAEGTPFVVGTDPADGATDVPVDIPGIRTTEIRTNGGVDLQSLTVESVYLVNLDSGERVEGQPGTSGGGDSIYLVPEELEPQTEYQFNITSAVKDVTGQAFAPYTATFTTGTGEGFDGNIKLTPQPTAARVRHSSMEFTSDGNFLYATTIIGEIKRYPVGSDGSLGAPQTFNSLIEHEGGENRLTVGLAIDPNSTPSNPIIWVTHTYVDLANFDGDLAAGIDEPWSGKLTRLSGPNLENVEDIVIGLPRSNKDHVTNSVAFNPAERGVVYFVQGSNTAMGAPDNNWGPQGERALSGAVLRLDTSLLGSLPLDAQTEGGASYDPFAPNAPLTVYASGVRNSYDLVWHSNGNLYVPANGSAAGGIVPRYNPVPGTCENRPDGGYTGPVLDSPSDVPEADYVTTLPDGSTDGWRIEKQTLPDFLFNVVKGGYYGTPNPKRCEWILNGGGMGIPNYPTTKVDLYPDSVEPDPNYRGPAFDFGKNISPNGAIEYKGNAFSNLKGKLLVARYANGDDIVALTLGSDGNATGQTSIVETKSFADPIEIAESPTTGYLYVSSYDQLDKTAADAGIILLRP